MKSETTCSVVIYDKRRGVIRTCGAKVTHNLIFRGDYLFAICQRHDSRIAAAIDPGDRCGDGDKLGLSA